MSLSGARYISAVLYSDTLSVLYIKVVSLPLPELSVVTNVAVKVWRVCCSQREKMNSSGRQYKQHSAKLLTRVFVVCVRVRVCLCVCVCVVCVCVCVQEFFSDIYWQRHSNLRRSKASYIKSIDTLVHRPSFR